MPVTTAIIVNFNGVRFLRANLPTVLSQSVPFTRIIVIDNGSTDGSIAVARQQSGITLISLTRNVGFCAAANRGIEWARCHAAAELIALLNNDVALDSSWHQEAWTVLSQSSAYGSCATCLLRADNPERVDTAGITWIAPGYVDNYLTGQPAPAPTAAAREVFGACAGAALYRREFLEDVGVFDETLFAYQEDVDLALRGQRAGWRCVFAPRARGYHAGFGTNRPHPLGGTYADFFNARNRLSVLVKSLPATEWRTHWKSIVRMQWSLLARSVGERRSGAVFLGLAHAVVRLPATLRQRRVLADQVQARARAERA